MVPNLTHFEIKFKERIFFVVHCHTAICFVCLFKVLLSTLEFFTHIETSSLTVEGIFILGTLGHGTMRVLQRATFSLTLDIGFKWLSPWTRDTQTWFRALSSGAVAIRFNDLSLSRPGILPPFLSNVLRTEPLRRSNAL